MLICVTHRGEYEGSMEKVRLTAVSMYSFTHAHREGVVDCSCDSDTVEERETVAPKLLGLREADTCGCPCCERASHEEIKSANRGVDRK